jgi:hypothetical protein
VVGGLKSFDGLSCAARFGARSTVGPGFLPVRESTFPSPPPPDVKVLGGGHAWCLSLFFGYMGTGKVSLGSAVPRKGSSSASPLMLHGLSLPGYRHLQWLLEANIRGDLHGRVCLVCSYNEKIEKFRGFALLVSRFSPSASFPLSRLDPSLPLQNTPFL